MSLFSKAIICAVFPRPPTPELPYPSAKRHKPSWILTSQPRIPSFGEEQSPQVSDRFHPRTPSLSSGKHQAPAGAYFESTELAAFLSWRIARMLRICLRYKATEPILLSMYNG